MKVRRIYLVEFMLARRRRRARGRKESVRSQLDLPGLPDYSPHDKPELQAIVHTAETASEKMSTAEVGTLQPSPSAHLLRCALFAPLVGIPLFVLLDWRPHLWLLFSFTIPLLAWIHQHAQSPR